MTGATMIALFSASLAVLVVIAYAKVLTNRRALQKVRARRAELQQQIEAYRAALKEKVARGRGTR